MKNILYKIAFFFAISYTLVSCGNKTKNVAEEEHHDEEEGKVELTNAQFKSAGIQFGKVEMKNLRSTISVNGFLDVPPQNMVSVSAMMGGFIKSTPLLEGLKVSKGQVIATIQNPDFIEIQSQYLESKEKLKFLELEYKRQEELSKENVSSAKVFQQVTSEYNSLKVSIGALEERLNILNIDPGTLTTSNIRSTVNIYSPIDGNVTTVNINIGKFVNPQDVICEIVNTGQMHAELIVFEKDISKIKKGQKVRFTLVNEGNQERMATIYLVDRQISEQRTVRVHAIMDKNEPDLTPNTYFKALIEIGEGNKSTALPDKAIVNVGDKFYIFIKDDGHGHEHEETEHEEKETHAEGEEAHEKEHKHTEGEAEHKEKETANAELKHEEEEAFRAIEIQKGVSQNGYTEVILPEGFETDHAEVVVKGAYALLSKMNNSESEGHAH